MTDLGTAAHSVLACRGCDLAPSGPVPLYLPLHVVAPAPLILLDRPFVDVAHAGEDPRRQRLLQFEPRMSVAAVSYVTSCWSDRSLPTPNRARKVCTRHRNAELRALQPSLIAAVGEDAARFFLGDAYTEETRHWVVRGGIDLVILPELFTAPDIAPLAQVLSGVGVGYDIG